MLPPPAQRRAILCFLRSVHATICYNVLDLLRAGERGPTLAVSALDTILAIAEMAALGQKLLNVFQFLATDDMSDSDATSDIATFLDDLYQNIDGFMDAALTFDQITLKNVTQAVDMGSTDWPTLTNGSNVGDLYPLGVAGLITLGTAKPGTRGRKFIPGLDASATVESLFSSSLTTALTAFGAGMVGGFVGGTSGLIWAPGVLDKLGVFRPFTSSIVTNLPAYQRRRKQGVGA